MPERGLQPKRGPRINLRQEAVMVYGERKGHIRSVSAVGICLLAFAVWLTALPVRAGTFGELIMLQGKAVITRGDKHMLVRDRITVEDGDRVDTLADSKARLVIGQVSAGMEAVISSRTSLTLNQLQQSATAPSPISLAFGALRTRVRSWAGQPFVTTRVATIGIKGTDFVTWVKRPQAAEFVGVEGLIECVSTSNKDNSLRIGQRQWGEIVENEKPKAPIRVPDAVWDAVQKEFAFPK